MSMVSPKKMRRRSKFILKVTAVFMAILSGAALIACGPKFGKLPEGQRLERLQASPNYADGQFRNQIPTPMLAEGVSRLSLSLGFLFRDKAGLAPERPLPSVRTDLKNLDRSRDLVIWLGHSSSYAQLGGRRILIDPVFSDHAAPFSFLNKAFVGDYPYAADDFPEIDLLVISHDHWDHLDYPTLMALKPKIRAVACPLGVGSHLEHWGFAPEIIHEGDWHEELSPTPGLKVHVLPARHFSGRLFRGNRTLWAGFLLETPRRKVFYSGDSGYGPHFAEIGAKFGPADLAIMENGQYDPAWRYIHMMPEEAAQGTGDLGAKAMLPVHSGRFTIANHAWDDPYRRVSEASHGQPFRLMTPMIGEVINLEDPKQAFGPWWEEAE